MFLRSTKLFDAKLFLSFARDNKAVQEEFKSYDKGLDLLTGWQSSTTRAVRGTLPKSEELAKQNILDERKRIISEEIDKIKQVNPLLLQNDNIKKSLIIRELLNNFIENLLFFEKQALICVMAHKKKEGTQLVSIVGQMEEFEEAYANYDSNIDALQTSRLMSKLNVLFPDVNESLNSPDFDFNGLIRDINETIESYKGKLAEIQKSDSFRLVKDKWSISLTDYTEQLTARIGAIRDDKDIKDDELNALSIYTSEKISSTLVNLENQSYLKQRCKLYCDFLQAFQPSKFKSDIQQLRNIENELSQGKVSNTQEKQSYQAIFDEIDGKLGKILSTVIHRLKEIINKTKEKRTAQETVLLDIYYNQIIKNKNKDKKKLIVIFNTISGFEVNDETVKQIIQEQLKKSKTYSAIENVESILQKRNRFINQILSYLFQVERKDHNLKAALSLLEEILTANPAQKLEKQFSSVSDENLQNIFSRYKQSALSYALNSDLVKLRKFDPTLRDQARPSKNRATHKDIEAYTVWATDKLFSSGSPFSKSIFPSSEEEQQKKRIQKRIQEDFKNPECCPKQLKNDFTIEGKPFEPAEKTKRPSVSKNYVQNVIKTYHETHNNAPLPIITNLGNAFSVCGAGYPSPETRAQEENVAACSTIRLTMPNTYYSEAFNETKEPKCFEDYLTSGLDRKFDGSYRGENATLMAYYDENKQLQVLEENVFVKFHQVVVAAPDLRENDVASYYNKNPDNYIHYIARAAHHQCLHALEAGLTTLIAGALGCGIFQNNPYLVALIHMAVFQHPEYEKLDIQFAIIDKTLSDKFEFIFAHYEQIKNIPIAQHIINICQGKEGLPNYRDKPLQEIINTFEVELGRMDLQPLQKLTETIPVAQQGEPRIEISQPLPEKRVEENLKLSEMAEKAEENDYQKIEDEMRIDRILYRVLELPAREDFFDIRTTIIKEILTEEYLLGEKQLKKQRDEFNKLRYEIIEQLGKNNDLIKIVNNLQKDSETLDDNRKNYVLIEKALADNEVLLGEIRKLKAIGNSIYAENLNIVQQQRKHSETIFGKGSYETLRSHFSGWLDTLPQKKDILSVGRKEPFSHNGKSIEFDKDNISTLNDISRAITDAISKNNLSLEKLKQNLNSLPMVKKISVKLEHARDHVDDESDTLHSRILTGKATNTYWLDHANITKIVDLFRHVSEEQIFVLPIGDQIHQELALILEAIKEKGTLYILLNNATSVYRGGSHWTVAQIAIRGEQIHINYADSSKRDCPPQLENQLKNTFPGYTILPPSEEKCVEQNSFYECGYLSLYQLSKWLGIPLMEFDIKKYSSSISTLTAMIQREVLAQSTYRKSGTDRRYIERYGEFFEDDDDGNYKLTQQFLDQAFPSTTKIKDSLENREVENGEKKKPDSADENNEEVKIDEGKIDRFLRRMIQSRLEPEFDEIIRKETEKLKSITENNLTNEAREFIGGEVYEGLKRTFMGWLRENINYQENVLTLGKKAESLAPDQVNEHRGLFKKFSHTFDSCFIMKKSIDAVSYEINKEILKNNLDKLLPELTAQRVKQSPPKLTSDEVKPDTTKESQPVLPEKRTEDIQEKKQEFIRYIEEGEIFDEQPFRLFQRFSAGNTIDQFRAKVGEEANKFYNSFEEKMKTFTVPPYTLELVKELIRINQELKKDLATSDEIIDNLYKINPNRKWTLEKAKKYLPVSYAFAVTSVYFRGRGTEKDIAVAKLFEKINSINEKYLNKTAEELFLILTNETKKKFADKLFAIEKNEKVNSADQLSNVIKGSIQFDEYKYLERKQAEEAIKETANSLTEERKVWLRSSSAELIKKLQQQTIQMNYEERHLFIALLEGLNAKDLLQTLKNIPVDNVPIQETLDLLSQQGVIEQENPETIKAFFQRREATKDYIKTAEKSQPVLKAEEGINRKKGLGSQPGRDVYVFSDLTEYQNFQDINGHAISPIRWFLNLFLTSKSGGRHIIDSLGNETVKQDPLGNPLGVKTCPQHNMIIAPRQQFFRQGGYGPWPTVINREGTATVVVTYAYEFENFTPEQIQAEECPYITTKSEGFEELKGKDKQTISIFRGETKSTFIAGALDQPQVLKLYFNSNAYKNFVKDKLLRELKALVETHKQAGITGPIQANMTLPGLGYFSNMGGNPAYTIRDTLSPVAIEAYQEALQELNRSQENNKDETYIAAIRVSYPESAQDNADKFNEKFVECNKQGIVVKATTRPVDDLTEIVRNDLRETLHHAVSVAGDPRAQPGNEKRIESAEPGIFDNFAFAREFFNPLKNVIKLHWFNLSKSNDNNEYELQELTKALPAEEEIDAHEKNIEIMATIIKAFPFKHAIGPDQLQRLSNVIQDSSFVQRFEEISFEKDAKTIEGESAIDAILRSRRNTDSNYILVRQKTFPGRSNEWYLYHLHDGELVKRNIDKDPSLNDLSSILKHKNFADIAVDEKIKAQCIIDDFFTKKKLLKEQETKALEAKNEKSIIKIHSSPEDHNDNIKNQALYLWKTCIQPKISKGEHVAFLYAANQRQAKKLYDSYTDFNVSLSDIFAGGKGQAKLFREIALLIEEKHCRDKVHILPIPTSLKGGDNRKPDNQVSLDHINMALNNVAAHKGAGFTVLGLAGEDGQLLLGGGASKGWENTETVRVIEHEGGRYEQKLVDKKNKTTVPDTAIQAISQGRYTDQELETISTKPTSAWKRHLQQAHEESRPISTRLSIFKKIDPLIENVIKRFSQLSPLPDDQMLHLIYTEVQNYKKCKDKDKNKEKLWVTLVNLCREHNDSRWRRSNPKVDLLCRAIAEFDVNTKHWSKIQTLDELIIAQQKRDAIEHHFKKELARLSNPSSTGVFDISADPKLDAYQCLIEEIYKSDVNATLSLIVKDDSLTMREVVKGGSKKGKYFHILPGTPYATIQDVLYDNRGFGIKLATSKTKLDELRDELTQLDPRTVLNSHYDALQDVPLKKKPKIENQHKIAALLDVDQTLINDRDGSLNESLMNALITAGITDIYITTDMTGRALSNESTSFFNRMRLKRHLEELGFTVTIVTTGDVGYQSGLGSTFEQFFAPYYGKKGDDLEKNIEKYAGLMQRYNLGSYLKNITNNKLDEPDRWMKMDAACEDDLPIINELKEMLTQIRHCLRNKQCPKNNDELKTYFDKYLNIELIDITTDFSWQDFSDCLAHKLMLMETDIYKLQAGNLAKSRGYCDDKGALYDYVFSNLPADISSVVVADDKRSCLISANQVRRSRKLPIPLSTIQVMVGSFVQIHGKKTHIPKLEEIDIQNEEIKIYCQRGRMGGAGQIVAFWCQDGEIIQQIINEDKLNDYLQVKKLFDSITSTTPRAIRATDKNEEFKAFVKNIPAIFDQYPKHKNDFDSDKKEETTKKYVSRLNNHIDRLPRNASSYYYKNNLLHAALIEMRDDYVGLHQRSKHHDDVNHLIREVEFILQQSDDHKKNTQKILDKIEDAFEKEEKNFRKSLFGSGKSSQEFMERLNQPSKNYQYPRMLLALLKNYSENPKYAEVKFIPEEQRINEEVEVQLTSVEREKQEEKELLQKILAENPKKRVFFENDKHKVFFLYPSKHFPGEWRIDVASTSSIQRGKEGVCFVKIEGTWKIGKDKQWHFNQRPDQLGGKIVTDPNCQEDSKKESIFVQENLPSHNMKTIIVDPMTANQVLRMGLAHGDNLSDIIQTQYRLQTKPLSDQDYTLLTKEQRIKLCIAITRALQEQVHDQNVIHLDMKPGNIKVDLSDPDNPRVKIIDFDLSDKKGLELSAPKGTLRYIPPEILDLGVSGHFFNLSEQNDVFSLGVILAEVLIGPDLENSPPVQVGKAILMAKEEDIGNRIGMHITLLMMAARRRTEIESFRTDPLITYIKSLFAREPDKRPSVEDCIEHLEEKIRLKDVTESIKAAYQVAHNARNALRTMRLTTKDKFDTNKIKTIIKTSLEKVNDDPDAIKEYVHTLGITSLKDCQTKVDIIDKVEKIIFDFHNLPNNAIDEKNKAKIDRRYNKYNQEVVKSRITLDGMAELNHKNKNNVKNNLIKDFAERKQSTDNITNISREIKALPWFSNHIKHTDNKDPGVDFANLVKTFETKINSRPNLLGEESIKGRKYERDLTYRAGVNCESYMQETQLTTLEELLIYQQKKDVIAVCCNEIDRLNNNHSAHAKEKRQAFNDLLLVIQASLTNRAFSVPEVISAERKKNKDFAKFFLKYVKNLFSSADGKMFNKICTLPHPKEFIPKKILDKKPGWFKNDCI